MAPVGWLDIHGHFYPPPSATFPTGEQLQEAFHSVDFMTPEPVTWSAETTLSHNDAVQIDMQMLSYIPPDHTKLRAANDYGNSIVQKHPSRFGLLAALPTDDTAASLAEVDRVQNFSPKPDGFAVTTVYNDVGLGDTSLDPLWDRLNELEAVVFIHPNAYAGSNLSRPAALIEVAFDTCRTVIDMIYHTTIKRFPKIKFILAHSGGALPALSSRLTLLGAEAWIPNPNNITREDIERQLGSLFLDTAATARSGMAPAVKMVGAGHVVYGSDCGVPCSTVKTMDENMRDVVQVEKELGLPNGTVATNGWTLFVDAAVRAGKFGEAKEEAML